MISELTVNYVELPLDDGRFAIVGIDAARIYWTKIGHGDDRVWYKNGTRKATPREMLVMLRVARKKIDLCLERIDKNDLV
jgi:hypothetical protein